MWEQNHSNQRACLADVCMFVANPRPESAFLGVPKMLILLMPYPSHSPHQKSAHMLWIYALLYSVKGNKIYRTKLSLFVTYVTNPITT